MTLFHTCCETLHRSGGGNEGEWEEDSSGGLIGHCVSPNRGERSTRMSVMNRRTWSLGPHRGAVNYCSRWKWNVNGGTRTAAVNHEVVDQNVLDATQVPVIFIEVFARRRGLAGQYNGTILTTAAGQFQTVTESPLGVGRLYAFRGNGAQCRGIIASNPAGFTLAPRVPIAGVDSPGRRTPSAVGPRRS